MTKGSGLDLPETGKTRGSDDAVNFGLYADAIARSVMAIAIAAIFIWLNYAVMSFVRDVYQADLVAVKAVPTASRIVTTGVLQSLIGATVVQVGIAIVAIMSYLFPKRSAG